MLGSSSLLTRCFSCAACRAFGGSFMRCFRVRLGLLSSCRRCLALLRGRNIFPCSPGPRQPNSNRLFSTLESTFLQVVHFFSNILAGGGCRAFAFLGGSLSCL